MSVAIVTGANSGIGNAFAQVLLKEGYRVHAVDRDVGEGLRSLKGAGIAELDVTSEESIQKFKDSLKDEPIDLLLNIAGIAFPREKDTIQTASKDAFEKMFAVNTFGPMFLTQALLPNIEKSSNAKICIMTSRVASISENNAGGMTGYRASKAAANSIGKTMAIALKEKNIPVLMLHPGFVRSGLLPGSDSSEHVDPEEAATKLWKNVISVKGMDATGTFWHREGYELPW